MIQRYLCAQNAVEKP